MSYKGKSHCDSETSPYYR